MVLLEPKENVLEYKIDKNANFAYLWKTRMS